MIFVVVGYIHKSRETQKLIAFNTIIEFHINNPLPKLRLWILLNLLAQLANLTETIVFASMPSIHCKFDPEVLVFGL